MLKLKISQNYKTANNVNAYTESIDEILQHIKNEDYLDFAKDERPSISQSTINSRPKNDISEYSYWSGFQAIDLDIKNAHITELAKQILTELLFKYGWVKAIATSSSKNGLHIYTFTKPLPQYTDTLDLSSTIQYEYYMDSIEYKMMIVWKACHLCVQVLKRLDIDQKDILSIDTLHNTDLIDITSARISQLLAITADKDIRINENFEFTELNLPSIESIYTLANNKFDINILKEKFDKLRNRKTLDSTAINYTYSDNQQFDDSFKDSIIFNDYDLNSLFDNAQPLYHTNEKRYRLAYTLAYLFDLKEHGSDLYKAVELIFLKICSGNPKFANEKYQYANVLKSAVDRNIAGNCPCIWSSLVELRDIHKFNISVELDKNQVNSYIESNNTDDKIKSFILNSETHNNQHLQIQPTVKFDLATHEYIGNYFSKTVDAIKRGTNLLIAPPGYGKTEFIKQLSKDSRVLLVEPYTSIISSKIEKSDLGFQCFYGDKPVNLEKAVNACMTFDKFCKIDIDEVSMLYDYVAIDESHLLCMSAYRDRVTADVIDNINKLTTKCVLMTGTPIAEHIFTKLNSIIEFKREVDFRSKNANFVICQNNGDKLTKIASHIANALKSGKKILFPTNKGDEYTERIAASVKVFYGSKLKFKYYKKDNQLSDFVDSINNKGTIGDIDILFCSNYLSVGVDINDTTLFDVIYDESFVGQEIEQFNCRLRKLNIESYVYVSKVDSNNQPKQLTLYEDLSLELTHDENLSFADIKRMHTNNDNSDSALFDFFKYAFNAPYFIKDKLTGNVYVHNTCYRLHKFEEKWRDWSLQINVIANTLKQYDYTINVLVNDKMHDDDIDIAVESAKIAASEYRLHKLNLVKHLIDIAREDESAFEFILTVQYEDIIDSDKFEIVKKDDKLKLLCADSQILSNWRRIFRILSKYYKHSSIFAIIDDYCFDGKKYNISSCNKLIDALRILQNTEDDNLVDSNIYIIDYIVNTLFAGSLEMTHNIDAATRTKIITSITSMYIKHSASYAESIEFKQRIEQLALRIFKALTQKTGSEYRLITLPAFDSLDSIHRQDVTNVIMTLFGDKVELVKANQRTNTLGNDLSKQIKEFMNSDTEQIEQVKHIVFDSSFKQHNAHTIDIDLVRDINVDDYKFKRVYADTLNSQSLNSATQTNTMPDALDDKLSKIFDKLGVK